MSKPSFKIITGSKVWDDDFDGLATYNDEKVYFFCSHEYLKHDDKHPDEVSVSYTHLTLPTNREV